MMRLGDRVARFARKAAVALVIFLIAGEIGVRILEHFFIDAPVSSWRSRIQFDRDYWRLKSGAFVWPERYGDIRYEINSHGYRDEEFSFEKTGKRVLFFGDSVAFGLSVPNEDTYVHRLKTGLKKQHGVEAFSLALLGYSPFDHLNAWQRIGKSIKPDVVVLQLVSNDFFVVASDTPLPLTFTQKLEVGWANLSDSSALLRRLGQLRAGLLYVTFNRARRQYFPETLFYAEPEQMLERWRNTEDPEAVGGVPQLRELIAAVRASGATMIVVYTPWEFQIFSDKYDGLNLEIAKLFSGSDVTFLDPLQQLRASPDKVRLFREGVHFSKYGHAVVADVLRPEILKSLGLDPGKR